MLIVSLHSYDRPPLSLIQVTDPFLQLTICYWGCREERRNTDSFLWVKVQCWDQTLGGMGSYLGCLEVLLSEQCSVLWEALSALSFSLPLVQVTHNDLAVFPD